jgi:hypothetical protein
MRPDPIISGGWIKAALVVLVAGALGVGAYLLASGVDVNLPDLNTATDTSATTLSSTTLEDTTIGQPPPAGNEIDRLRQLNRCTEAARGDIDKITACFDRFNGQR